MYYVSWGQMAVHDEAASRFDRCLLPRQHTSINRPVPPLSFLHVPHLPPPLPGPTTIGPTLFLTSLQFGGPADNGRLRVNLHTTASRRRPSHQLLAGPFFGVYL